MDLKKSFFFKTLTSIAIMAFFFSTNIEDVKAQEDEEGFTVGGAVRFNYISTYYESDHLNKNNTATWDTWRLNVDGSKAGIDLSFEYRFYPTFGTHFIHHGYLGYNISDKIYTKLGVFQKPFGITKYASHSWWFQLPYYVGLEDDYDIGLGFDIDLTETLKLNLAYFRHQEPEGPIFGGDVTFGGSGAGRYSYDVVPAAGASNRELNNFNVQALYNVTDDVELGLSGQYGGIYNTVLDESESALAFAGHVNANLGDINFKGEYVYYSYGAKDDAGNDLDAVTMGAYGFAYPVAAEASMYVAGISYNLPIEFGPVSGVQAYVDYTLMDKANSNFENTHHLVPGFLISAGGVYTYVDFALGKNQPWLTDDFGVGLGQGRTYSGTQGDKYYSNDPADQGTPVPTSDLDWNLRFNVNVGYYF